MGRASDMRHMATPTGKRGALWWMQEHAFAEFAVIIASRALDAARDEHARHTFARQLDTRLDHLEACEDICFATIDRLHVSDGDTVAGACEAHYLRGESWGRVAAALQEDARSTYGTCTRALCRLDRAGVGVSKS